MDEVVKKPETSEQPPEFVAVDLRVAAHELRKGEARTLLATVLARHILSLRHGIEEGRKVA